MKNHSMHCCVNECRNTDKAADASNTEQRLSTDKIARRINAQVLISTHGNRIKK